MYRFAICDDDTDCCVFLEKFIRGFFSEKAVECYVDIFSDARSLSGAIDGGIVYDLLFLDILLGDESGMEYARRLRAQKRKTDIIFITTSREYAIESYDVEPLYYILKPIEPDKLTLALGRFLERNTPDYICFSAPSGLIKIRLSDILYFEIYGHRVIIHKIDGNKTDFRGALKDVEAQLPPAMFIRPHRSYIVNIGFITEIMHYSIKITNGELIPVSRALYNKIQLDFVDYLDKKDLFL